MVESSSNPIDLNVLGLNSGTSMDSIDIVLCNFKQESIYSPLHLSVLKYDEMDIPNDIKTKVLGMIEVNDTSLEEVSQISVLLGKTFAKAASDFCTRHNISKSSIDIIGSHGQTIWYIPYPKPGQTCSVLTLAEACYIAQEMETTVVSDFRISEQSVGREGAPMISFFDSLLLIHPTKLRACQNIGGIANVCFVFPENRGGLQKCFEFDTGPGNVFIDAAMRYFSNGELQYDKDGLWGIAGTVDEDIVDDFLAQDYFHKELPKTTGRELFGDSVAMLLIKKCEAKLLGKRDIIATLTRITAKSIVKAYQKYAPYEIDELYLCGGGAFNPNIVSYIQKAFPKTQILPLDVCGVQGNAKESITFAFQGLEAILGRSLIVPDKVNSKAPVVVGKVAPGDNYRELQKIASDFGVEYQETPYLPPVQKLAIDVASTKN